MSNISGLGVRKVEAVSGSSWKAGRIIDDLVFNDSGSMSVNQIQDFLNQKVGTGGHGVTAGQCDTNGVATSEYGGGSRAQYGSTHNNPAPFTCLKDYYEVPKTSPGGGVPDSNYGGAAVPAGALSAAQLISDAAVRYRISPKVLLVMIQKESAGPLTTDDWPFKSQYTYAMGAHCPDSGPGGSANCDPNYSGFSIQISESAALMRWYIDNMSQPWWSYKKPGNNSIQFNPNVSCGSSNIFIENVSTAALYTYTPYQPNQAALNNLYGLGDGCSAYGNRNFWRIYNDWFGPAILSNLPGCEEATNTTRACVWSLYNPVNLQQYLTSSVQTRDDLYLSGGYQYAGKAFFANSVALPGNIPIYRASAAGGGSFLTADKNEYNTLIANGYTGNGIDFYADPSWSNTGPPVYRLYNSANFQHYWTSDPQQRQSLLQSGYNDEGIAYTSISTVRQEVAPPQGKLLVYRFYIPESHSHLWTTDVNERDIMIRAGYQYEGVAWNSSANTSSAAVYRLYAPSIKQHLYTTDASEKNNLVASGGWTYETISQYVSNTANSRPVYRLYAPTLGVHLLTTDINERQQLVSGGGWNDEGIAWYQP